MANFFESQSVLTSQKTTSAVKTVQGVEPVSYIAALQGEYKVIAYFYNEVKFGRVAAGELTFADGKPLAAEYLLELRIFAPAAEYLIKRGENGFEAREIVDGAADGQEIEYVDSVSNIFGDVKQQNQHQGYAALWEEGRKIKLEVPVDTKAEHYALKTRSYITYDKDTMQAGFGYYRFLDVVPAERG